MALHYPPLRRIQSPADLVGFVNDVHQDPNVVSALDTLVVVLDLPYPTDALREALSVAVHIEDLILRLSSDDTPDDILEGLHFARLEFFKTNLPHRYLTPFVSQQPSLRCLCLGPCGRDGREPCPLRTHNVNHIIAAEYPMSCSMGLAPANLLRLSLEGGCNLYNAPTSLRFIRSLPSLFSLTLDFFPDDYDILESVVQVAPQLQKLKLIEKHRTYRRRDHSRRAWNDVASWSRNLFRLEYLEDLVLSTSAAFLPASSALSAEKSVILKWASRRRSLQHRNRLQSHPTLSFIRLWYHRSAPGNGVITAWSRSTGIWQNISRIVGPPLGTPF